MSDGAYEQLVIGSLLNYFSTFLTAEALPKKRPLSSWKTSLRRDLTIGPITTGRVFFESGGAQAWAAYEAVRPTTSHCKGQTKKGRYFAELDRQPLEFKANLARKVGTVVPHPTLAEFIALMAQEALDLLGRPEDAEPSIQVASAPSKRRRTEECSREANAGPLMPPPPRPLPINHYDDALLAVRRHHDNASPAAGGQAGRAVEVDEYVGAHIQGLVQLVPPLMASAIKRYEENGTVKARVKMLFQRSDLDLPCDIKFDIVDQKVEFLAQKLFNAHLERDGPAWVSYYDNGTRMARIGHGFTLLSCTTEAIPSFFGSLIAAGNAASPRRQEEARAGYPFTKAVTMELHREVGKGALISLSLGSIEGCQVFEKLYAK